MSRNELNIEDLFRTRMESFKVDPSAGLWRKVHARILWKRFLGFRFRTFNVYYLAAVVSLTGAGAWLWLRDLSADTGLPEPPLPASTEMVTAPPQGTESGINAERPAETEGAGGREAGTTIHQVVPQNREMKKEAAAAGKTSEGKQKEAGESLKSVTQADLPEKLQDQPAKKAGEMPVSAGFTADNPNGCSPLAVSFRNRSENAVQYNWTFGDGGSSVERDPSYVFDEPGDYDVVLRVRGADGREYIAGQTITVHETPKARFEMDEGTDLAEGQPVYFYNFSRGADFYAWDFGDRQQSNLEEPMHLYANPGSYDIKLKVWNVNRCYDSMIVRNAFTGDENNIIFPNAFTPNLSGPSGGSYDPNDVHNTVFHPVVKGELIEYQLKIFNRQGILVFESNDLSIGWDGYYREKLAAQAVYIWKVRGKFSNGKTFVRSGDVTLIRQY